MSKLEIEFEITGLKLKIKGESEDVAAKVAAVQKQVQNALQAVNAIADGATGANSAPSAQQNHSNQRLIETTAQPAALSAKGSKTANARKMGSQRPGGEVVDFRHDAEAVGFPKQEWVTGQKAMWMLYVLSLQTDRNEFSASTLAATFNKHFKSFGTIRSTNVLRDLAKEKGKSGSVNSDASQEPQMWFLLEEGKKAMAELVRNSRS
jgi:hypothetical protein